jgi:hypothetical protein
VSDKILSKLTGEIFLSLLDDFFGFPAKPGWWQLRNLVLVEIVFCQLNCQLLKNAITYSMVKFPVSIVSLLDNVRFLTNCDA